MDRYLQEAFEASCRAACCPRGCDADMLPCGAVERYGETVKRAIKAFLITLPPVGTVKEDMNPFPPGMREVRTSPYAISTYWSPTVVAQALNGEDVS
jgi:hypothetical protein